MSLTDVSMTISLDVYNHDETPSTVKAIALDAETRYVNAQITQGGQYYDVGQTTTVTLTVIRPDKTGVQVTGDPYQYTVLANDSEITLYGAQAELSQTALAVKGTLKAQFIFTSGDQILRTEIFTINCGEALDASTSTWAGEYQGYNLDELVQNVNESSAKVDAMEEDVSDLKEGFSNISSMLYTYTADSSLWSQGRLSNVNGSGYNDTTTAIKSLKIPDNIEMVTALTGYKIAIFAYTKAENTYVGVWNGSELAQVNYYFEQTTVDISNLNSTYNIKLMARAISGENVTVDNAVNVLFGVKTLTNITDSVDAVKSKSDGLFDKGFIPLENVTWARGGWYANNDFRPSMYKYCAAVYPAFATEKDTVLVAKRGFKFRLSYTKSDGTRETFGNACMGIIPSGATAVNLTVERIAEDHTEELTEEQVAEFGNAIMSVGYHSTDYTNYRDTFTGLEMYESMAVIGDSYSAGNNSNNWGKCLDRMIGTSVTVWAQSGYDSSDWITTYLSRLLEADAKDLYWINLGINDGVGVVSDPSYLGSSADVDETVYTDFDTFPNTFWGNMGRIIRNIQTHAPNAKIVLEKTMFATMLNAQRDLPTTATATINSAIVEIGAFYGIPVIDQLDDAFYCSKEYARSITSNHPRKYTWVGMANANRRLFARAVLANPEYFY